MLDEDVDGRQTRADEADGQLRNSDRPGEQYVPASEADLNLLDEYLREHVQANKVGCHVIGVYELNGLDQSVDCHTRRHTSRAEQQHDFELLLPRCAHPPGQRYGNNEDDKIGDDGERDIGQKQFALVETVAVYRRVPVRADWCADANLEDLNRRVGDYEE